MAEMISGKVGLGYYTWKSYTLLAYEKVLLGIILMGLFVFFLWDWIYVIFIIFVAIEWVASYPLGLV